MEESRKAAEKWSEQRGRRRAGFQREVGVDVKNVQNGGPPHAALGDGWGFNMETTTRKAVGRGTSQSDGGAEGPQNRGESRGEQRVGSSGPRKRGRLKKTGRWVGRSRL